MRIHPLSNESGVQGGKELRALRPDKSRSVELKKNLVLRTLKHFSHLCYRVGIII